MNALDPKTTFLWHDYETWGTDTRYSRPAQFAAIRTDRQLNEVQEPIEVFCQLSVDVLPDPQAALVTGISPQFCRRNGLPEYRFAQAVYDAFSKPYTIGLGYNTLRFDDEITRFLLWRNLLDPYAREWQNGCSRWDLLDVVRLTYALRPEGIVWPTNEEGLVSFRLEHLSAANGLAHENAHDALSDVRATIALAKLIVTKQPKLFEFALKLRKKEGVAQELSLPVQAFDAKPFLHVSGMFPVQHGCLAVMFPLAAHPINRNEIIAWDLRYDPRRLLDMDASAIRALLFVKTQELPPNVQRLPIKTIHLNKSPMVVSNLKVLKPERAQTLDIDLEQSLVHAQYARQLPDMSAIWAEVYALDQQEDAGQSLSLLQKVDGALYAGFIGREDRARLERLRQLEPQVLALENPGFDDMRLAPLVFLYRARNFPQTLNKAERQIWQEHCAQCWFEGENNQSTVDEQLQVVEHLAQNTQLNDKQRRVLRNLDQYFEQLPNTFENNEED